MKRDPVPRHTQPVIGEYNNETTDKATQTISPTPLAIGATGHKDK